MKCSTIRRVIDEVDNPANLPYEAAGHLEECVGCRQFAGERQHLRKMLLEPARVSAPADFEAVVARRLAQRGGETRPFWLAGGFYLRTAGAAAALACMILVIQVTLLKPVAPTPFSHGREGTSPNPPAISATDAGAGKNPSNLESGGRITPGIGYSLVRGNSHRGLAKSASGRTLATPNPDVTTQLRALLLVRGSGAEHEIAVPMVSVGAQPWLSVSLRSQEEQGVRTAF
jgi:hypothetical protein